MPSVLDGDIEGERLGRKVVGGKVGSEGDWLGREVEGGKVGIEDGGTGGARIGVAPEVFEYLIVAAQGRAIAACQACRLQLFGRRMECHENDPIRFRIDR